MEIKKLDPRYTTHLRGFDGRGAGASITDATADSVVVNGVFRDMADFAVVVVHAADNRFEHHTLRYLPNFDFSDIVWSFDIGSTGAQPIDSPKYEWIDWRSLDVTRQNGEPGRIGLWKNAELASGTFDAASATIAIEAAGATGFDRLTLWLNNIAFDYIADAALRTSVEFQFFASGTGTTHNITIAGRSYTHIETAGQGSADVAAALVALVNASSGDADCLAAIGSVSYAVLLTNKTSAGGTYTVSATGGGSVTLTRFGAPVVAAALADQINGANWSTLGGSYSLVASASGANLTVTAGRYGVVVVAGTSVSWQSGERFQGLKAGDPIYLDGVAYVVASVANNESLTLTAAGPTGSRRYQAPRGGVDGNTLKVLATAKNARLKAAATEYQFAGGSSDCVWRVTIDFAAEGFPLISQAWLTFAPLLTTGADYTSTEWVVTLDNWSVAGSRDLPVAGFGSVRVGSVDAWVNRSGSGWSVVQANNLYRGLAWLASNVGDSVSVRYSCQFAHDLYIGTELYRDRGVVSVSLDGDTSTGLDCYVAGDPPVVTRRRVRSAVAAGEHVLTLAVTGAKHSAIGAWDFAATDHKFLLDYVEAVVEGDVPAALPANNSVSPALDYSTDATYQMSPARLFWSFDMLGFFGRMNKYVSVFWPHQRIAAGRSVSTLAVDFSGTWADGDAVFIDIGGFVLGKSVFATDTSESIARHFAAMVNNNLVAVRAEVVGSGQLRIKTRTANWGDTSSVSVTSAAGVASATGSLAVGVAGKWVIDPSQTEPLTWPAREWHRDFYALAAASGREVVSAISMELVNPPVEPAGGVWAARFPNGEPVETDIVFGSLKSTHLTFSADVQAYQSRVMLSLAQLQSEAGLPIWLQFGEFLWWFFSYRSLVPVAVLNASPIEIYYSLPHGLTSGDKLLSVGYAGCTAANGLHTVTVVNAYQVALNGTAGNGAWVSGTGQSRGGGMGYYDTETTAAASVALGRPLRVFHTQDDDPSGSAAADVAFLQARLKSHVDAIRADVLAVYPSAKFELLYPYDVHYPTVYATRELPFPQGGRLNHAASLPPAWKTKAGSGLDSMKIEALSWGSFYRVRDKAFESIRLPFSSGWDWPADSTSYLVPWFNSGCPWPAEFLEAIEKHGLVCFWAYDHLTLLSWPAVMPKREGGSQII